LREKYSANAISIAFPRIVIKEGIINDAATLWGDKTKKMNLAKVNETQHKIPTFVLNDVSAAGYKEAENYN